MLVVGSVVSSHLSPVNFELSNSSAMMHENRAINYLWSGRLSHACHKQRLITSCGYDFYYFSGPSGERRVERGWLPNPQERANFEQRCLQ